MGILKMYYLDICSFVHYRLYILAFLLIEKNMLDCHLMKFTIVKVLLKIKEIIGEVLSTLRFPIEEHNFKSSVKLL